MVGAASFHQPRALRSRFRRGLGFTALVMAALVAIAVKGFQGSILDLAPMPECAFTLLVPAESVIRSSKATNIVRQAGGDELPGGAPVLESEAPPMAEEDLDEDDEYEKQYLEARPNWETARMSTGRVKEQEAYLRTLKGKFMPYGSKPWHKRTFLKAQMWVLLDAKQAANTKIINQVTEELRRVTGVCPRVMTSKKNIAQGNIRKGAPNGVYAQMKKDTLSDFLNRLNTIILPRIRDFEGLSPTSFDNMGNFAMSIPNQEAFKELDELIDERELVHTFYLQIDNNCYTRQEGLELMKAYGFPFGDPRPPPKPKEEEYAQFQPRG